MNSTIKLILILGTIPLMISCDKVYISTPQPIDSKNIYLFPGEFRGMWTNEAETIIIGKDYFKYTQDNEASVSKQELDTSSSYVLKDHKIYIIDKEERTISEGFPVKLENDSIYYKERGVYEIALGKRAFLRKVKKNYILNFKEENQWWQLKLIRKDKKGNIYVEDLVESGINKFTNYKKIHSFKDEYSRFNYIEANWSKKELLDMINKGVFSDTLVTLKLNNSFCY